MSHEQKFIELHGNLEGSEKAYMIEIPKGVNPFSPLSGAIPHGARAAFVDGVLYVKAVKFNNPEATELQV